MKTGLPHIVDAWNNMRSEQKNDGHYLNLHAVDIIPEYLSTVDLQEAAARCKRSYMRGFTEPFFPNYIRV